MYFLGFDLGSSAVKACLFDGQGGRGVARASAPDREMKIDAPESGWAEQAPETWWQCAKEATTSLVTQSAIDPGDIRGIGISYQMHGLVLVGDGGGVLRPSIIWCDSRAVEIGNRAFQALGEERCLGTLLSSPGNFTASKLAWVRAEEPEIFKRVEKAMLPGDYFAWRLTDRLATTVPGLSEGMFWDFSKGAVAEFLLDHLGIPGELLPDIVPTFGQQGALTESAAEALGLAPGIPVTYRAGDQPNNALSLNVLEPGDIAATAGTSGVVYGVSDTARADPESRVNSFAHVNHSQDRTRLGVLLCINGAGSANRHVRDVLGLDYAELNRVASEVPAGCDGLRVFPFGNGAERMLGNRDSGATIAHLDFNRHTQAHVARAVQEGVAFSFRYGLDILKELGIRPAVIRAGLANMFLSPVFREALTATTGVSLELYRTDGAEGAARGAAVGAGFYESLEEAFEGLTREELVEPDAALTSMYEDTYSEWTRELAERLALS